MMRAYHLVVLLLLATAAGCLGLTPAGAPGETTPTDSGPVLTVTNANQTVAEDAPSSEKGQFEALDGDRQDEFVRALNHDVEDPTAWSDGTDIQYVHYEGTWYSVQVVIVN